MVRKIRELKSVEFGKLVDTEIQQIKPSIVTELEDKLELGEAGEFTLSFSEWMGLRRAVEAWKRKKIPPRLEAKLLSFEGKGSNRTYKVAVKRPKLE